jgi:7-cyano-7-deazaguanine synthase
MKKAVCLISGGLDSYVAATIAKHNGYSIFALTLRYGQKNNREISCAKKISAKLQAEEHLILDIDLSWVDSALTNKKIKIANTYPLSEIPATYVPARNTIFISLAIAFAETIDAEEIYLGINSVDFSGYPDCKPEYIKKFQSLLNVATKKNLRR